MSKSEVSINVSKEELFKAFFESNLTFRVEIDKSDLWEYLKQIGEYNQFNPKKVYNNLGFLKNEDIRIEIGREYSPVIYITSYSKNGGLTRKSIDGDEKFIKKLEQKARKALADEINTENIKGIKFVTRIWFD
jgi:hypothetical protein